MSDVTISVRVDESIHQEMKAHDEINWSAAIRKSIAQTLQSLHHIDQKRAESASKLLGELCKQKAFSQGKSSVEVIREWRSKRK